MATTTLSLWCKRDSALTTHGETWRSRWGCRTSAPKGLFTAGPLRRLRPPPARPSRRRKGSCSKPLAFLVFLFLQRCPQPRRRVSVLGQHPGSTASKDHAVPTARATWTRQAPGLRHRRRVAGLWDTSRQDAASAARVALLGMSSPSPPRPAPPKDPVQRPSEVLAAGRSESRGLCLLAVGLKVLE